MMATFTYTVEVGEDKAGARIDRLLAQALPEFSRTRLKALIEESRVVAVGLGAVQDPAHRARAGDVFTVSVPAATPAMPRAQSMPLDIVFEDSEIIIVNKPAGLVVHPAAGHADGTLVNGLLAHCHGSLSGIGGVLRPGIVHRLDKDTSGLMVVAKTDKAHLNLAKQFAEHSVERGYLAVVWGTPKRPQGSIDLPVGRSPDNRKKMAVVARGGKPALTRYQVLKSFRGEASLLDCRPATGRTHQIRVHLAALGHPLVGDPLYGGRARRARGVPKSQSGEPVRFDRQALHAYLIGINHPSSEDQVRIECCLPRDMSELIGFLEIV